MAEPSEHPWTRNARLTSRAAVLGEVTSESLGGRREEGCC
jgi:hypothetical protein